MKIVIDVGCARYGDDFSIERLIEWHHPDVLYGFDPSQGPDEYPHVPHDPDAPTTPTKATRILIEKKAAWTFDGEVRFRVDGLGGHVSDAKSDPLVPCVDLAKFILDLGEHEIHLKLDCEGSEYLLLDHLIDAGADEKLASLIVEWHPFGILGTTPVRRKQIERRLRCPLEEWLW